MEVDLARVSHTFELSGDYAKVAKITLPADESGRLAAYKAELDEFRARISGFEHDDTSEILGAISAIAGRVAEIRADLQRVNTPRFARLRTTEVDPLREDLEFQFKVTSRRIAWLEWEFKLSGGGT